MIRIEIRILMCISMSCHAHCFGFDLHDHSFVSYSNAGCKIWSVPINKSMFSSLVDYLDMIIIWVTASIHSADRHLIATSPKDSKPPDSDWDLPIALNFDRHLDSKRCRDSCQISERYDHYNIQSQSRLRDFARFRGKTSVCSVNRGPGCVFRILTGATWWRPKPMRENVV